MICRRELVFSPRGAREHPSSAAGSLVMFELGHSSSASLVLSRQVSSTHRSVRRELPDATEPSEGGTMAANSSLRCCSIVTSSDISSEKCELSIVDPIVTHDCELMSSLSRPRRTITYDTNSRASVNNSGAAFNEISKDAGFVESLLALGSSRCGLKKITASQCPKFLEMRFKARRLLKFAQRFPTSTLGQKINLVWGQKSPVVYRKNFKEFLGFPKIAQQHSRGSCVHWKRRIKL